MPVTGDSLLRALDDIDHDSCDLARGLGIHTAYNEEAFRYFLANERKRSELSNRPFLLLLVELEQPQAIGRIQSSIAPKLFARLSACLRDTDLIGWYHEGRVAGAVLTHVDSGPTTNVSGEIRTRVTNELSVALASPAKAGFQVRIYQLPAGLAQ